MFAIFRKREFSLMWLAQLVSTIGSSLTDLAAGILVWTLTGSALNVGLVLIVSALPTLFVGLFAGVFVDRFDRKRPSDEHQRHDRGRDPDRDEGAEEQVPGLSRTRGLHPRVVGWGERGSRPDVVARRLDRAHELCATNLAGQVLDRRDLGGEIHDGILDAGGALQEALDPIDARGTGHALDGQRQLDGGCR